MYVCIYMLREVSERAMRRVRAESYPADEGGIAAAVACFWLWMVLYMCIQFRV